MCWNSGVERPTEPSRYRMMETSRTLFKAEKIDVFLRKLLWAAVNKLSLLEQRRPENKSELLLFSTEISYSLKMRNSWWKNQSSTHPPKHPIKNFTKLGAVDNKFIRNLFQEQLKVWSVKKLCLWFYGAKIFSDWTVEWKLLMSGCG